MFYVFDHPAYGVWQDPNGEFPSYPEYVRCSRPVDYDGYWCPYCYNVFNKFTWIESPTIRHYKCEICGGISHRKDKDVISILEKN